MNKERIKEILDSIATEEEKKILLMYKGKKYTLEEYVDEILPQYVIIKGNELLLRSENGYVKLEDFIYDIISDYKKQIAQTQTISKKVQAENPTEEIPATAQKGKIKNTTPTLNEKFKQLVIQKPRLAALIYDSNYMLDIIKESNNSKTIWYYVPEKFKKDESFMLEAIKYNTSNYYYADVELKKDKYFALKCVNIDGLLLESMSGTYNEDISFEPDRDRLGNVYNYAERPYSHKNDCDVVEAAIRQNPEAIRYAEFSDFLINNSAFNEKSIKYTSRVKSIMIEVISYDPTLYEYTPEQLKNDEDIINAYNMSKDNKKGKSM